MMRMAHDFQVPSLDEARRRFQYDVEATVRQDVPFERQITCCRRVLTTLGVVRSTDLIILLKFSGSKSVGLVSHPKTGVCRR